MEQGVLFNYEGTYNQPTPKKVEKSKPKPQEPYEPKPITMPPKTKLTYQDYLKIHCGNKLAANYWYTRNEGRPLT